MTREEKQLVQDEFANLFSEDFRLDFEQILEISVQVIGSVPSAANDELRSFQGHCADALSQDDFQKAQLDIARAKQNIQIAKYECLRLTIAHQIDFVRDALAMATSSDASKVAHAQRRLQLMNRNFMAISPVQKTRAGTVGQIGAAAEVAISANNELEALLTEISIFIADLHDSHLVSFRNKTTPDRGSARRRKPEEGDNSKLPLSTDHDEQTPKRAGKARTKIGRAVLAHCEQLLTTSGALILLIDERLVALREQRPNSPDGQETLREEIVRFEQLQERVEDFRTSAQMFADGETKEAVVVESTMSLAEGIQSWWTKRHQEICDKTFDVGLFGVGVGLCSLAGASGVVSVAVAGVLAGRQPVVDALKAISKLWSKGATRRTGS